MKKWLGAAALAFSFSVACIDLESAHKGCFESGRCGDGGTDAGAPDSGVDAGVDAGFDAGFDAGVAPYDGGAPCSVGGPPRLRCSAAIPLGTGSFVDYGQIYATSQGFLVSWQTVNSIEVRSLSLAGAVTTVTSVTGLSSPQHAIDARGSQWALAYLEGLASTVKCVTSANPDAGITVAVQNNGPVEFISAAVSPTGGVGIAAIADDQFRTTQVFGAQDPAGCPAELKIFPNTVDDVSTVVVYTGTDGGDGFRYLATDPTSVNGGDVELWIMERDGGTKTSEIPFSGSQPRSLAGTPSTSGNHVLSAYSHDLQNSVGLSALNLPSNLTPAASPLVLTTADPTYWATMPCGPGCASTIRIQRTAGPATVAFYGDTQYPSLRAKYDALCNLPSLSTKVQSIGAAVNGSKIGVVYTDEDKAEAYLCDMPPLP